MFKKNIVIGVSVTPEAGLEIAQIDYATKTVLKYGRKSVEYNVIRRDIADYDLFKESLQDLLEEMDIPKGSEVVLNMPTVAFKVTDYPASLDGPQIESAIEEELYENPYLKDMEAGFSYSLVSSTLQFNKIAYSALQNPSLSEIAIILKDIGFKLKAIDTSVNSILNSLIYMERVNVESGTNWLLLIVEDSCARVLSMSGKNYLDAFEENISIGDVLSDAENYATVNAAVEPILKNIPAKYLCVVSKTNVISAEVLANKISYSAPIIYQEANVFRRDEFLEISPEINSEDAKAMSLDVIGAGIYSDYVKSSYIKFNLFNHRLGDLYFMEQPPSIMDGKIVLTDENLIKYFIIFASVVFIILVVLFGINISYKSKKQAEINNIEKEITKIEQYLEAHSDISAETFDEGDEIKIGLVHNKGIYSYYTIVGTEIPEKLWLTHLKLGNQITIEGQSDNLESVYGFFRNIKDYNPNSDITLQKLSLAASADKKSGDFDTESLLTTMDADFYEFRISNAPEEKEEEKGNNENPPKDFEIIDDKG